MNEEEYNTFSNWLEDNETKIRDLFWEAHSDAMVLDDDMPDFEANNLDEWAERYYEDNIL